jgi:predicted nucleic acid-binding protein
VIVIDASALSQVLLRTPAAEAVEQHLFAPSRHTLHAPHLLDVEVAQVLRRYVVSGEIQDERGRAALDDLADYPIQPPRCTSESGLGFAPQLHRL